MFLLFALAFRHRIPPHDECAAPSIVPRFAAFCKVFPSRVLPTLVQDHTAWCLQLAQIATLPRDDPLLSVGSSKSPPNEMSSIVSPQEREITSRKNIHALVLGAMPDGSFLRRPAPPGCCRGSTQRSGYRELKVPKLSAILSVGTIAGISHWRDGQF
jgi:hypothetical protein